MRWIKTMMILATPISLSREWCYGWSTVYNLILASSEIQRRTPCFTPFCWRHAEDWSKGKNGPNRHWSFVPFYYLVNYQNGKGLRKNRIGTARITYKYYLNSLDDILVLVRSRKQNLCQVALRSQKPLRLQLGIAWCSSMDPWW